MIKKISIQVAMCLLSACGSVKKSAHRPFEIFIKPTVSYQDLLENEGLSLDERRVEFRNRLKKIEVNWRGRRSLKEVQFQRFQDQKRKKFNEDQIKRRDEFVKVKPSGDMLRNFLSQQAANQRELYRKMKSDENFFKKNEKHIQTQFNQFILEKNKNFEKALLK